MDPKKLPPLFPAAIIPPHTADELSIEFANSGDLKPPKSLMPIASGSLTAGEFNAPAAGGGGGGGGGGSGPTLPDHATVFSALADANVAGNTWEDVDSTNLVGTFTPSWTGQYLFVLKGNHFNPSANNDTVNYRLDINGTSSDAEPVEVSPNYDNFNLLFLVNLVADTAYTVKLQWIDANQHAAVTTAHPISGVVLKSGFQLDVLGPYDAAGTSLFDTVLPAEVSTNLNIWLDIDENLSGTFSAPSTGTYLVLVTTQAMWAASDLKPIQIGLIIGGGASTVRPLYAVQATRSSGIPQSTCFMFLASLIAGDQTITLQWKNLSAPTIITAPDGYVWKAVVVGPFPANAELYDAEVSDIFYGNDNWQDIDSDDLVGTITPSTAGDHLLLHETSVTESDGGNIDTTAQFRLDVDGVAVGGADGQTTQMRSGDIATNLYRPTMLEGATLSAALTTIKSQCERSEGDGTPTVDIDNYNGLIAVGPFNG